MQKLYFQMNKFVQDYQFFESIGSGQYGDVFRAVNRKTNEVFAIKSMSTEKFKQTPKLSEFTNNEIAILSKINHPNIIKFVQMLKTQNHIYLVYEFCNGGTLGDYIRKRGRLPQAEALIIFKQLRSAFECLNASNILHRDLKPTNILFHNNVVKLADFGFCKQLMKEHDMAQTMVGSPIYMAPQLLKGLIYDSRADIWSLGVILYEMIYGQCPYEEGSIPKLINLIDNSILKFYSNIPITDNTKMLLKRMLALKYRQRITPSQFIKYPLQQIKQQIKSNISPEEHNFLEVARYIRKGVLYLCETIQMLTPFIDDTAFLRVAFIVYKVLLVIQKDTNKGASYWELVNAPNNKEEWTNAVEEEVQIFKPFGDLVKETLIREDPTLKTKLELQTNYADTKYFLECIKAIGDPDLRMRLLNCFLYHKHFVSVMQNKTPDFTDPQKDGISLNQKEQICYKFARYY